MTTQPTSRRDSKRSGFLPLRHRCERLRSGHLLVPLAIASIFFAAIAPTLNWADFYNSMENLNIETALEIRRDGHWIIPRMQGLPRIVKPPLTAWLTALTVRPQTVAALNNPDANARARTYAQFTWEARWFALLCSCAMLVMVYQLGRVLGNHRLGLLAALICGSTLFFLRFGREALTDVHLALWVTFTNVFLAIAVVRQRKWLGCIGAGVGLGLAMMSKGPVAILESVLPMMVFLWLARHFSAGSSRSWLGPIVVGTAIALFIELPWYALVVQRTGSGVWQLWINEILGTEKAGARPDPWYAYIYLFFPLFLPWIVFLIAGAAQIIGNVVSVMRARTMDNTPDTLPRTSGGEDGGSVMDSTIFALLLVIVPIIVMSFFRLKQNRYLLPMVGPASIVAAVGLMQHFRWCPRQSDQRSTPDPKETIAVIIHWAIVAVIAIGLPLAGAMGWSAGMRTVAGSPIYPRGFAWASGCAMLAIVLVGIAVHRRWRPALLFATVALMLGAQAVYFRGFGKTYGGSNAWRPLAERLWDRYPDAKVFHIGTRPASEPLDLWLYLDRPIPTILRKRAIFMTPSDRPILALLKSDHALPHPYFRPGWEYVDFGHKGDEWWYVYVLSGPQPLTVHVCDPRKGDGLPDRNAAHAPQQRAKHSFVRLAAGLARRVCY